MDGSNRRISPLAAFGIRDLKLPDSSLAVSVDLLH
jgi:hypothetical protein